ncbi:MAG: transglycosylase domain-containing protein [Bacteroidales bacterium]|jgi:penicillin-binding protein 1A|nr:transglycosylase domain-containing protein [Bacteroidales bacterium]
MTKLKFTTKFYLKLLWILFSFPIITLAILFFLIGNEYFGPMPSFKDLENPENNLASEVFSEDSVLLGKYYFQNRSFVNYQDLSPNIVNSLIATEDVRFKKHSGIDARGLARVFLRTIVLNQESAGGGSTITQQLAKNLFPRDTSTYNSQLALKTNLALTKFKEWITAVKLEKNYTKEEILAMYLNTVPFGGHSFGIKSASKNFFNTSPDSLKIEEAAVLVGLLKAPSWYNPVRNTERSLARRNIVLSQMEKYEYLSKENYDSIIKLPIELNYNIQDHNFGLATYFREHIRQKLTASKPIRKNYYMYSDFIDDSIKWENDPSFGWCNKNKKPSGENYNIYKDGLKIYSTINSKLQRYAESAVNEHIGKELQKDFFNEQKYRQKAPYSKDLSKEQINSILKQTMHRTERYRTLRRRNIKTDSIKAIFNTPVEMTVFSWKGDIDTVMTPMDSIKYYKYFLHTGFLSISPHDGHVKAYVGGVNFRYFKFDHISQGKRQVGSTIKPFLYTLAMQEGYSPCHKVPNISSTFYINDTTWAPKNSGPSSRDGDMVTLKWGLANSVNWISAWLIKQFNPKSVIKVMRKMGIRSKIDPVPSIFLGTSDITLSEMVSAYCTFANKGVHPTPLMITHIEDKNGNVISNFKTTKTEAISEETAYLMLNLLQGVVREGTGIRLRFKYQLMNDIGGKTGTTQNQSDGWFMGITPNLVSGVWVGGEDRSIHFKNIGLGQGANMALPIWALYMQKVYNDSTININTSDKFEAPLDFDIKLNCDELKNNSIDDYTKFF